MSACVSGLEDRLAFLCVELKRRLPRLVDVVEETVVARLEARLGSRRHRAVLEQLDSILAPAADGVMPLLERFLETPLIMGGDFFARAHRGFAPLGKLRARRRGRLEVVGPLFEQSPTQAVFFRSGLEAGAVFVNFAGGRHVSGDLRGQRVHVELDFDIGRIVELDLLVADFALLDFVGFVFGLRHERLVQQLGHMRRGVAKAAGRSEDTGQGIVVPGQDRVEFVVVAARAGNGQAEHRFRDDFDLLVIDVVEHPLLVLLRDRLGAERQKAGSRDAAGIDCAAVLRRQQVAGDLLADEAVIGHVGVERVDYVVAVAPSVRVAVVFVVAGRIGIARDIQPMTAPALAVSAATPTAGRRLFQKRRASRRPGSLRSPARSAARRSSRTQRGAAGRLCRRAGPVRVPFLRACSE